MVKCGDKDFVKLTWKQAFYTAKRVINLLNVYKQLDLTIYPGDFLDLESAVLLKKLTTKLGVKTTLNNNDQFSVFLKKEFASTCILIDLNLRVQLPVLNANLRRSYLKYKTLVYFVGYYSIFNFFVKHLGSNQLIFSQIFEGIH